MALSPWLTLRQAREALRAGRPDEAQRLLDPLVAEGYRKAVRLLREVARAHLARGEKHLRADNADAAWADLLAAEALNTGESAAIQLRQTLTRLGLAVCRAALEAGNPVHVVETAARLRRPLRPLRRTGHPGRDRPGVGVRPPRRPTAASSWWPGTPGEVQGPRPADPGDRAWTGFWPTWTTDTSGSGSRSAT